MFSPPTHHYLLLLLLLLLFLSTQYFTTTTTTTTVATAPPPPHFLEAPQFYNSPRCPVPPLQPTTTTISPSCSPSALVHVAMTLDVAYLRGSLAAILSILHHTSCPQSVQFHFVASTSLPYLHSTISSTFPYLSFHIYPFDPSLVSDLITSSIRPALDMPLNYARSYLSRILPRNCPSRVVYLDSDIILVDDIFHLASTPFADNDTVLAAPEYCNANFTSYFTPAFWANPVLSLTFAGRQACYFNTGVMVIDLDRWRSGGYTERIEEWMALHKRMRIYNLGSLPPFLLVFAGRIAAVDHRWNQHGLGGDNYRGLCRDLHPGPVSLLHWSGKGKPWARLDAGRPCPLDALWAPYDLLKTSLAVEDQ